MKVVYVSYPDEATPPVLASAPGALGLRPLLEDNGHELVTTSDTGTALDEELAEAEVLITTPFWPVYLSEQQVRNAKNLRLVLTAGIGSDHIDWDVARDNGITVAEVTGSNVVSVAEHNVLQILALVRNFVPAYRQATDGGWDVAGVSRHAHDLEGKTVGMVGLGAIGARTALRLKNFDVRLLYYANHRRSPADEAVLGAKYSRLDDLIAESDVVCLALPLMAGSQALIGPERLAAMKEGAWLVNTARGAIVDRDALVESLANGHLGGYAGDTWHPQPAPADHPWRTMPAHAMTIHYSGMTVEAQRRIASGIAELLRRHLDGDEPPRDYVLVKPE
ncbi:NAD-dependent formate dehydrogenase [Saccharomonospora sp. NPDC006951]